METGKRSLALSHRVGQCHAQFWMFWYSFNGEWFGYSGSNSSPKGTSSVPVLVAGSGPRGAVTVCISLKKHLLKSFKFLVLVIDSKYRKIHHCKRTHSPAAGPDKVPDLYSTQKAFQMLLTWLVFWGELLCFPGHLGLTMFPKHCGACKPTTYVPPFMW